MKKPFLRTAVPLLILCLVDNQATAQAMITGITPSAGMVHVAPFSIINEFQRQAISVRIIDAIAYMGGAEGRRRSPKAATLLRHTSASPLPAKGWEKRMVISWLTTAFLMAPAMAQAAGKSNATSFWEPIITNCYMATSILFTAYFLMNRYTVHKLKHDGTIAQQVSQEAHRFVSLMYPEQTPEEKTARASSLFSDTRPVAVLIIQIVLTYASLYFWSLMCRLMAEPTPMHTSLMTWAPVINIYLTYFINYFSSHAASTNTRTGQVVIKAPYFRNARARSAMFFHEWIHSGRIRGWHWADRQVATAAGTLREVELCAVQGLRAIDNPDLLKMKHSQVKKYLKAFHEGYDVMVRALEGSSLETDAALLDLRPTYLWQRRWARVLYVGPKEDYSNGVRFGGMAAALFDHFPISEADSSGGIPWAFIRSLSRMKTPRDFLSTDLKGMGQGGLLSTPKIKKGRSRSRHLLELAA